MRADLIIRAIDPAGFAPDARQTPVAIRRHGDRYRVAGGRQQLPEGGDTYVHVMVSAWPVRAAALSPGYLALKALRAGAGEFEVRPVDSAEPANEDIA